MHIEMDHFDPEAGLHIEEFKIRLTKADADWIRATARKTGTKPAILLRTMARREIDRMTASLASSAENRRRA